MFPIGNISAVTRHRTNDVPDREHSTGNTRPPRILAKRRLGDRIQAVIFAYETGVTRAGP